MCAFAIFYWFAIPTMASGFEELIGIGVPESIVMPSRMIVIAISLWMATRGILDEGIFSQKLEQSSNARVSGGASVLKSRVDKARRAGFVTEQSVIALLKPATPGGPR